MSSIWSRCALWAIGRRTGNGGPVGLSDLVQMRDALTKWRDHNRAEEHKHRERWAKLKLIHDRDADYEKRQMDSAQEHAASFEVGIRALSWAIDNLKSTGAV